jgi:hypothetical protein
MGAYCSHGRSQFVGGVRCEPALAVDGGADALEQAIQADHQRRHLGGRVDHVERRQVVGRPLHDLRA